ncbi:hypothetical protein P7C73_g4578, partial [Tremellales sp. Uapishka_1]
MSDSAVIHIPSFPPSPPATPTRLRAQPEWFTPVGKRQSTGLTSPPSFPVSPTNTILSLPLPSSGYDNLDSPLTPDEDCPDSTPDNSPAPIPRTRESHQSHRRTSTPTYYFDTSSLKQLPTRPPKFHRARFASEVVTGSITPLWSLNEEALSDSGDDDELRTPNEAPVSVTAAPVADAFRIHCPTSTVSPLSIPVDKHQNSFCQSYGDKLPYSESDIAMPAEYSLNEDHFVLAYTQPTPLPMLAFRPRLARIPRHKRPLVTAIACIVLFGSLLMISILRNSLVAVHRASMLKEGQWMAQARAVADGESVVYVEEEAGYRYAAPAHHKLDSTRKVIKRHQAVMNTAADLTLSKEEELGALMNLIVGTTANTLPAPNAAEPLDVNFLLPFNPRAETARLELQELVESQWEQYPIMIVGNMRDPKMRDIKKIFRKYNVRPEPHFVEVDQRADKKFLAPTLERLLGVQDGPYVLLAGRNIGSAPKLAELERNEVFIETISASGAAVAKKMKKNKHQREEERLEDERVLGPHAITE